ncbi:glycosyltransferase [Pseudopelagicola sp. nBUS_20]|uniref:glycosyltransferase family protein n=1 Tax=Pseudopelagicola sp. nBUS_20 TaxID=3395317 RepID=UPI003EB77421
MINSKRSYEQLKCFFVFNKKVFMDPRYIIYPSLIEALTTLNIACEVVFEEQLEGKLDEIGKKDTVIFVNSYLLDITSIKAHDILAKIKGVKLSIGFDDEYRYRWTFNFAQHMHKILTFDPVTLEYLSQLGVDCSFCPHPLKEVQINHAKKVNDNYDVSFIGRVSPDKPMRYKLLKAVENEFPNSFIPGMHGQYVNLEIMHSAFQASKVNLNLTGISDFNFDHPLPFQQLRRGFKGRPFEIGACGGFCLSELSPSIQRALAGTNAIDFFEDIDECLEKIEYYLKHVDVRIAKARQLNIFTQSNILSNQSSNLFGNEVLNTIRSYNKLGVPKTLYERYPDYKIDNNVQPSMELERLKCLMKNHEFFNFIKQTLYLYRQNFLCAFMISGQLVGSMFRFLVRKKKL